MASAFTCQCPECHARLGLAKPVAPGTRLKCPKCSAAFVYRAEATATPPAQPPAKRVQAADEEAPPEGPRSKPRSKRGPSAGGGNSRVLLLGAVGGGVVVVAGALIVVFATSGNKPSQPIAQVPAPQTPTAPPNTLPKTQPAPQAVAAVSPRQGPPNQEPPVKQDVPKQEPLPKQVAPPEPPEKAPAIEKQPPAAGPGPRDAGAEPDDAKEPDLPDVQPVAVQLPPDKDRPWLVLDAAGHSAAVHRVLFTPDARRVLTVSADKTVRLWDVETGEPLRTFRVAIGHGEEGNLRAAALTPDGRHLAVGGWPYGARTHGVLIYLVSVESGQIEKTLKVHGGTIMDVAFSPATGKYLASGSFDKTVAVVEVSTGRPTRVLKGHTDGVRKVAWRPDGRSLASAGLEGTARIWDLQSGQAQAVLAGEGKIISLAWSPDSKALATGSTSGAVQLWSADGQLRQTYRLPPYKQSPLHVAALSFTPDGRELLYGGVDDFGRVGLIDVATGRVRLAFARHTNTVRHATPSPDGTLVASTGGNNDETFVWKTADGSVVQKFVGVGRSVWGVGWSRDGRRVAWGNTNRSDAHTRGPIEATFHLDRLELTGPPQGDYVRTVPEANGYALRQVSFTRIDVLHQGQAAGTFTLPQPNDRAYCHTLVPGDRAVVGSSFGLFLIDLKTAKLLREFRGHTGAVMGVALSPDGRHLLTGASDQTLCVWDLSDGSPLMSLFFTGRDWIAWTPQGYYACSAQGERLMGWQVNNGPEQTPSYYPAVQFRASLYRPDVVRLLRRAGSLGKALAVAGLRQKGPVTAVNVTQVLPPQVAITTPAAGDLPGQPDKVTVKATARPTGPHPVTAMRLLVDGRPYDGEAGVRSFADGKVAERAASWSVELEPGKHVLVVQAESPVSKGLSAPVAVARAWAGPKVPPNLYVLAVGISAYPGESRLNYAHADAIEIERLFRERTKGVFGKVETKLLTDRQATGQGIVSGLLWLKKVMTRRDVGILFFAGHGTQDPRGNFYLVPVDFNPKDPLGTLIPGELLKRALANMPGRLVAMLDACHSGASAMSVSPGVRPGKKKRPERQATDDLVRDLLTDDFGVVVMCSSMGHEYSIESPETKHGFFTLGLLEGLAGRADFNRDRVLHIHEVEAYAFHRVRQLSGGRQNPVTGRPPTIRSFPLARY